jgi:hypothetical protein
MKDVYNFQENKGNPGKKRAFFPAIFLSLCFFYLKEKRARSIFRSSLCALSVVRTKKQSKSLKTLSLF